MFDPKKYSTRMRDPDGKRKKPPVEERSHDIPAEATLRTRTTERFDEKRAEQPLPKLEKKRTARPTPRSLRVLVAASVILLIVWRLAAGAVSQALVLLILGGLGFFYAATRRRAAEAQRVQAARPPPLPRSRTHHRPTSSAPKPAPRPRLRESKPQRKSAWSVIGTMSLIAVLGNVATRACKSDKKVPVVHHYEERRPRTVQPRREGRTEAPDWRTRLPPAAAQRISGAILFRGQLVSGPIELTLTPAGGSGLKAWTDDRGLFVFDRLRADTASIEVKGNVHLGAAPRSATLLPLGTRTGVLELDRRHTIILQRYGSRGGGGSAKAVIQVAATTGSLAGHGTWPLGHKTAVVSGLAPAGTYDVLVRAPDANLAALVERVGPGQRVEASLGPGASLHGMVTLPPHASPQGVQVVLTHGQLHITAAVNEVGLWRVPALPRGSWWDVTARRVAQSGTRVDTRPGVHAGDAEMIVLDLR